MFPPPSSPTHTKQSDYTNAHVTCPSKHCAPAPKVTVFCHAVLTVVAVLPARGAGTGKKNKNKNGRIKTLSWKKLQEFARRHSFIVWLISYLRNGSDGRNWKRKQYCCSKACCNRLGVHISEHPLASHS